MFDPTYIFIGASIAVAIFTALAAFRYAAKNGQLSDLQEGSKVIFDQDEPIGTPTDSFPGARPGKVARAGTEHPPTP